MRSMHSRGQDMLCRIAAAQGDLVPGVIETKEFSLDTSGNPIPDEHGQLIPVWTPFGLVDVLSCQPFSTTSHSLESEQALQMVAQVSHVVVCTYLANVTNGMRIVMGDRTLYIGFTQNSRGLGKILNLYCGETLPA